ncbi:hypothetical protein DIPPA_14308 [Diplonema papillatum]|nr:hypothetical protein DIPPA_14308 [Diplonema papillatum]
MQSLRDFAAKLRTPNHQRALAYGMTNFSAAVLNNIFITYYVEMAVSVSKVSEGWFMSAQVIYCVWNSFNDPACGWWADTHGVEGAAGTMQRRLPRILRGGPPWAAAFVMMWFPWGIGTTSPVLAGLHLITVLLLYDGWLSYTLINHQALLADMTSDNVERERCNMYGAACQIAGSGAIFMAHLYWDTRDLNAFRGFAVAAALVSCGGFFITAKSPYIDEGACRAAQSSSKHYADKADTPSLSTFVKQTLRHRNLWSFILMGLLQQFACTFTTKFFFDVPDPPRGQVPEPGRAERHPVRVVHPAPLRHDVDHSDPATREQKERRDGHLHGAGGRVHRWHVPRVPEPEHPIFIGSSRSARGGRSPIRRQSSPR